MPHTKHVITHIVVTDNLQLNVAKANLSRSLASLEFDDSFEKRIPTATGFVPSLELYADARLVVNLKDSALSSQWSAQIQHGSVIGTVCAYDAGGRSFNLSSCSITHVASGNDGEPMTRITIDGTIANEAASAGTNA